MTDRLRTTAFRVTPESFGQVFTYRAGARFQDAWKRIDDAKERSKFRYLPHASLSTLLRLQAGDFVRLQVKTWDRDPYFIVSRRPIKEDDLRQALLAWEYTVLQTRAMGILEKAVGDLQESVESIADHIRIRPGQCFEAEKWVWDAARWQVAHRLAEHSLALDDGDASLRMDNEGGLLTWDRPVRAGKNSEFLALHRITPNVIIVPGINCPVVHLESSLARLTNKWSGVKSAWVAQNQSGLLLLIKVHHFRKDAAWRTVWSDLTAEVLSRASINAFPEPDTCELEKTDQVRARLMYSNPGWPIGKGPGQTFHEAVAIHARKTLQEARPLEMLKARRMLKHPAPLEATRESLDTAIHSSGAERLRIVCLYATDDMRQRMAAAVENLIENGSGQRLACANDDVVTFGSLDIVFRAPCGGKDVLTRSGDSGFIELWTRQALAMDKPGGGAFTAALIGTSEIEVAAGDADPKHVIRRAASQMGIVTQFLSDASDARLSVSLMTVVGCAWGQPPRSSSLWTMS